MKTITIVALLLISVSSFAQDPPWNDNGNLYLSVASTGSYTVLPFDSYVAIDSVVSRYGESIELLMYDDIQDDYELSMFVWFYYIPFNNLTALPEDSVWWQDSFTWGQLRPHLQAFIQLMPDGTPVPLQLPNNDLNRNILTEHIASYSFNFVFSATSLPMEKDDAVYKVWIEPATLPLPSPYRLSNDTLTVLKTTRSTPSDTLLWMERNWIEAIEADPELPLRMLVHFPNHTRILRHQFWVHYNAMNCDSLTHYGDKLIEIWTKRESGAFLDNLNFHLREAIEDVQERVHDICVDGEVKPYTFPLGVSEL